MKKFQNVNLGKEKGKSYLASLAIAVAFLFAANLKADVVSMYGNADAYMNAVEAADWSFGAFKQISDNKSPRVWEFDMLKEDASSKGTLTMSVFNGGGGLMEAPQGGSGTLSFWHNSANKYDISFGNADFVDSFFMTVEPHSSWSTAINFGITADYWLDGTKYTTDMATLDMNNSFFGIVLDEGAYLAGINFWSTGTPDNGYKVSIGLGGNYEKPAATPEPATLAMLGLGLAGLGLARVRRRK